MCVLHVSSPTDSFADFLKHTSLPVYQSHEKGDTARPRKGTVYDDFGFSCDVSERDWSDFPGQVEDAVSFLETHGAELKVAAANHRLDDIRLDFPVESRLAGSVFCQCEYLPPAFIKLCAEHGIGIELSLYVPGQKEGCEPGAPPNGGPATPSGNSGVAEGPPSVS